MHNGNTYLENLGKEQIKLKSDLGRTKQGNPKHKTDTKTKVMNNVTNLYESREKVIELFNNYSRNMSRNIYESKQGKRIKVLFPKQLLQRLPIGLAQIKKRQ